MAGLAATIALGGSASSAPPAPVTASTFQANAAHTGASAETFAPPLEARWTRRTPGRVVSYPVVAGGTVFALTREASDVRRIRAYSVETGRQLWLRTLSIGEAPKLAYGAGRLFAVTSNCTVIAIDPATGGTLWVGKDFAIEYQCVAPPVVRRRIVFLVSGASDGALTARDAVTGQFLWRRATDSAQFNAPIATRDRVFASGLVDVRAFRHDGTRLWAVECCGFEHGGGTGSFYRGRLYVRYGGGVLDAASGARVAELGSDTAFAFRDDLVFRTSAASLDAVDLATGQVVWTYSAPAAIQLPPLVVGGFVYTAAGDGTLTASRVTDGQPVWTASAPERFTASEVTSIDVGLAAGNGVLVAPHGHGITVYAPAQAPQS